MIFKNLFAFIILFSLQMFLILIVNGESGLKQINNFEEYREYIKDVILSQNPSFVVQINNFDANVYDLNKAIDQLEVTTPETAFLFQEAKNGSVTSYGRSKIKVVRYDFSYRYGMGVLNEIYVARNPDELQSAFTESFKNFNTKTYVKLVNYSKDKFNYGRIIEDALMSNPGFGTGYKALQSLTYGKGGDVVVDFTYEFFYDFDTIKKMRMEGDKKAREVVDSIIKPGMSDYEKEMIIHDYIVTNTIYDFNNYKKDSIPASDRSVYGVLINKVAVCEGYALTMKKLMDLAGVYSIIVLGTGRKELHAWNIVKIQDKFYQVDATWNDPYLSGGNQTLLHDYFNVTDAVMKKEHTWEASRYPVCNNTDYNYSSVVMAVQKDKASNYNNNNNNNNNNRSTDYPKISTGYIRFVVGNKYFESNGTVKEIDPGRGITPVIMASRTLVPIRVVIESLSGKVGWNDATDTITIQKGATTINLKIGSRAAVVNGKNKTIDFPATIVNSRTFVPLRFVTENLGYKVVWNDAIKEVRIFTHE